MAGIKMMIVMTTVCLMSSASVTEDLMSQEELTYDYPERYMGSQDAADIMELLEGSSRNTGGGHNPPPFTLRQLLNGLQRLRRQKKTCNIGAGLSGPCNNNDAVAASKNYKFFSSPDAPGRRRRHVEEPTTN